MFTILSLVTSVKDYIEIVHKLVETNSLNSLELNSYYDLGAILTYFVISAKEFFASILTFQWLKNLALLPIIVPDIAEAMVSEISVLNGYFHNAFTFLDTPISYGNQNVLFYGIEKFSIGLINSIFLCLPTSISHIITLRRFVMQGLEAGYLAGLGTVVGNLVWIGSIIFGLRFMVIPWLSLDILRYGLGFLLLIKYMWDSYSERRTVLEDLSKWKIFLLNFLLAFTEQATIYPFLSNLSVGSDATILENFPTSTFIEYFTIHSCYLLGLLFGSLSLLQFTCWFWENPAFNLYMWTVSSLKMTNVFSQKFVNLFFLYLTMFFSVSNLAYFGLDYTIANPLGLVHEDRLIDQKVLLETSFLNTKASDRNTRRNRGRHGRRERWKRRVRRYRTFDASLYDHGIYDLFTIEDLNYGFDRFWLRRKIRNHRVRFRFFPGPWMRSFKKQLARPRLESFMGPRVEFFRILFEQAYHPEFHEFRNSKKADSFVKQLKNKSLTEEIIPLKVVKKLKSNNILSFYSDKNEKSQTENLVKEHSALRKFVRKFNTRTNTAQILLDVNKATSYKNYSSGLLTDISTKRLYSKRWKQIFSKIAHNVDKKSFSNNFQEKLLTNFYNQTITNPIPLKSSITKYFKNFWTTENKKTIKWIDNSKQNSEKHISKKDRQILRYKTFLNETQQSNIENNVNGKNNKKQYLSNNSKTNIYQSLTLIHPVKFYLEKEKAFQKKLKFYGANLFRNFGIENNAPYYRVMMKKFFYYYKPTLRWERTMRTATMRKARRKGPRIPRKLNINKKTQMLAENSINLENLKIQTTNLSNLSNLEEGKFFRNQNSIIQLETLNEPTTKIQKPTHFYSLVSKRATRYRYQIYKDVLQHWYYTPFNRLFLKIDVDAFIRRQPVSHFLTKSEENLLHLKRFLLTDYYNTLRWYSYMQHYESMKKNIGKTKSFANGTYNQQFFGTFKKIRHLFAITPSLTENTVLKFDQPLFNEYKNMEKSLNNNFSFYNSLTVHEELLADETLYGWNENSKNLPEDLPNQSTKILKEYLEKVTPLRQAYILKLLKEKNYTELTSFLFKGEKIRGDSPITNQTTFLNQEKTYLLTEVNKNIEKEKMKKFLNEKIFETPSHNSRVVPENLELTNSSHLWISLMQKCRNMLYNQEALKTYVTGRVEKLEKQKKRQEKAFTSRLENMKNWVSLEKPNQVNSENFATNLSGLTTSLQKAIKEGIYYQVSGEFSGKNIEKSNLRNNRETILENLPYLKESSKNRKKEKTLHVWRNNSQEVRNISLNLKRHLENRVQIKTIQTFEAEQTLRKNFDSIQKMLKKTNSQQVLENVNPLFVNKILMRTLVPFKWLSNNLQEKITNIVNSNNQKRFFQPIRNTFKFLTKTKEKSLNNWKKRETVFSTRKKIRRKIYRVLDQKKQKEKISNVQELEIFRQNQTLSRQKQDSGDSLENNRNQKIWKKFEKTIQTNVLSKETGKTKNLKSSNIFKDIFEKNFKRKRTRSRRYRRFKGRGPIKKHTLAEKLKRQFKLLKRYGGKNEGQDRKMEILEMITKRKYNSNSSFETRETKQRRTRQSKHRYWKKHKRQKYLQIKRKQRKRRRYSISKLRVLNKEFKRIQSQVELKNWWWKIFVPNFITKTNNYWQLEKNQQIQDELENLSISDILERDKLYKANTKNFGMLQIGNQDFKPLAMPEALRLKNKLINTGELNFGTNNEKIFEFSSANLQNSTNQVLNKDTNLGNSNNNSKDDLTLNNTLFSKNFINQEETIVSNLSKNLFQTEKFSSNKIENSNLNSQKLLNINPIPFYAGWDETSRQFIVTNRLLSRKDAGYSINLKNSELNKALKNLSMNSNLKNIDNNSTYFTKSPLQGMNAATTLYWQIPFTTYDPDQFFALGMDGFSPLGWRFFNFKHSKQTTKPILVKNIFYTNRGEIQNQSLLSYNIQLKMLELNKKSNEIWKSPISLKNNKISKNQSRKIQKRQKRIKKHPRPPVWFPSGPLTNQVLPVHYIYVFYKRARLPRDRYIGRRFRRADDTKSTFMQLNFTKMVDFTLRKRVKPIRKYHRKRNITKNQETSLIIRRRPFKGLSSDVLRFRPISNTKITTQKDVLNSSLLKTKQRKKNLGAKQSSENLRIRQLRRRIQRQVLRPVWRYKPRSGGFVWPGDYFRLELIKAPTLKDPQKTTTQVNSGAIPNSQIRKKKRRNIQEWQIQPKKYLVEKHNLNVLKKRLQKSQNFNTIPQKIKQLNLMV